MSKEQATSLFTQFSLAVPTLHHLPLICCGISSVCISFATEMLFLAGNGPMMSPPPTCLISHVSISRLSPLLPLRFRRRWGRMSFWQGDSWLCHPCKDDDNHVSNDITIIWTWRFLQESKHTNISTVKKTKLNKAHTYCTWGHLPSYSIFAWNICKATSSPFWKILPVSCLGWDSC